MTQRFEDIIAWQKAHAFVIMVYKTTRMFPEYEKFGISSQFQRAAVSVAANIAEGYKKVSKADKLRFLNIAQGSLEECRYYCILSRDIGYVDIETFDILNNAVYQTSSFLNGYIKGIVDSK